MKTTTTDRTAEALRNMIDAFGGDCPAWLRDEYDEAIRALFQYDAERIDELVAEATIFATLGELIDAQEYWPSVNVGTADGRRLADAYDVAQTKRGDPRRANRYNIAPRD